MAFFDDDYDELPEGRVEALAKVTGKGKYAAEYAANGMVHAVLVGSTIASGKITAINTDSARQVKGLIEIITHLNKPEVPGLATEEKRKETRFGLPVFHTDTIFFKGQPIALVVAETLEDAMYAASLVTATYSKTAFEVDFTKAASQVPLKADGKEKGSEAAWSGAAHQVDNTYSIKAEVHNPMEMHATIAEWTAADRLKLYDKNQGVNNVQRSMSGLFGIPAKNVEVISEFVGGGFGSGLRVWPHTLAAVMAAKQVKRPVKLMLTRPQMFYSVGYRPAAWQRLKIGADADGKFTGIVHQARNNSSLYENFSEGITRITRLIYHFPHLKTESAIVPLNLSTPTWMRGPGECTGDFAIESAIDELSYQLKMDPVELRLKNLALDKHPESGLPWSTNYVDECVKKGAEMIGWSARAATPAATVEGDWQTGYGMAVGMWSAGRGNASAGLTLTRDGLLTLKTAMTDIGTGTGTGIQNMAAETTGMPKSNIKVELGNSNLPPAPSQGGSTGLSTISGPVVGVCIDLLKKLGEYAAAIDPAFANAASPSWKLTPAAVVHSNGKSVSLADIWTKNNLTQIELEATSGPGEERKKFAFCTSAAHYCKLRVNRKTGKVKIDNMVSVADGGKIVNEQAAANQMSGAAVGGIGMALTEEQLVDPALGSLVGHDFAGYHVAVNADAPIIQVGFINKPDVNINPSGAKGLGEVGIIGTAAAIANAIYHATGKRIKELPITPDKILLA